MALKSICCKAGCSQSIDYGTRWCVKHLDSETARLTDAERKRKRNSTKSPEAYQQSRLYATAASQRMRLAVFNEVHYALTTQPAFDVLRKLPHPQRVNIQSAPTLVGRTAALKRNMKFSQLHLINKCCPP